jgi:hypothetical protein
MRHVEPFLPEELKNLLRALIDVVMTADLSKVPQTPFAVEARQQLHADLRSKEPPTPEEARMRAARIEVVNLLVHVVSGRALPVLSGCETAVKLLNIFLARLR